MKITAHIRMTDTGRFEGKCKTLPGCPVIEARTFPQALQDLQEAIREEFIEQFYTGPPPGQIDIEPTALTTALTFSLDREINHSIFDFTPAREEEEEEPAPPRRMILGWGRIYRHDGYGPYHAVGLDGMAVCGRMRSPIEVSTDHPESGERVCKVCWGLVAGKADVAEEGEEAVEE